MHQLNLQLITNSCQLIDMDKYRASPLNIDFKVRLFRTKKTKENLMTCVHFSNKFHREILNLLAVLPPKPRE